MAQCGAMSRSLLVVALASTLAAPALAGSYGAKGLLRTGYSDRQLGPDRWEVRGSSHDDGGSVPVALYHAAEIASAANVAEIRVLKQKVTSQWLVQRSSGATLALTEKTVVTVRAIRTDADRVACEMPDASRCLTLPVAGLLAAYGPRLGMPAARAGEAAAAPVVLATSRLLGDHAPSTTAPTLKGGPIVELMRALAGQRARWMPAAASVPAPPAYLPRAALPVPAITNLPTAPRATDLAKAQLASSSFAVDRRSATSRPLATGADPGAYADRLRAARPVDHDARLGWSASD